MTPANASIDAFYRRILDCDKIIIDVKQNVSSNGDAGKRAYAQSFLREEVGKMYQGELVLTGVPEIEPWDVILLQDPTMGMSGPVEVDSVIHAFDQEHGFITIVRPRALVVVNEAVTMGIVSALSSLASNISGELNSVAGAVVATTAGVAAAGAAGSAAVFGGAVTAAVTGATLVTGGSVVLGALALAGITGAFWLASKRQGSFPVFICPLSRYNRPWVGGLEGYAIEDLNSEIRTKLQRFYNFEILPSVESYKLALQIAKTL